MGTEICHYCNNNENIDTEKSSSKKNYPEKENNYNQMNFIIIDNKNKNNKNTRNINKKLNINGKENNISNYDNQLYNTSVNESNNSKINLYNPKNKEGNYIFNNSYYYNI